MLGALSKVYSNNGSHSLSSLPVGQRFDVYDNFLTGSLSSSFGNWGQLVQFQVHDNLLTSTIPASLGDWKSLQIFDVSNNGLTGSLPESIGAWSLIM